MYTYYITETSAGFSPWDPLSLRHVAGPRAVTGQSLDRPWRIEEIIAMLSTIWPFNIAMENDPFIDDFPIKSSIYSGFSMAMTRW